VWAKRWLGVLVAALAVSLVAGCGDGSGAGATVDSQPTSNLSAARMVAAMQAGDSSVLKAEDAATLINLASANYQAALTSHPNFLAGFYQGLSTKFDLIKDSTMIQPALVPMENVFPLVIGDKGNVLASLSTVGGGRIAGYGYDILSGFDLTKNRIKGWTTDTPSVEMDARQTNHQLVFKRVLAWLVSADPLKNLSTPNSSKLKVAWASLPTSSTGMYTDKVTKVKVNLPYAADGLAALNIAFTNSECDPLIAPVADCAALADLVVIGAVDERAGVDLTTQLARLQEIIQKKIPLLYLNAHPRWESANSYARATWIQDHPRLNAMGFASSDQTDRRNYYVLDSVGIDLTADQLKSRNDPLNANLLARIASNSFSAQYDWSQCSYDSACIKPQGFIDEIETPLKKIKAVLDDLNKNGKSVFDPQSGSKTLQQLVLWADAYRKSIVYPINKLTQAAEFQKAYIADALVAYVRKAGSAQTDLGNFLSKDVATVTGSASFETIAVTIPGSDGYTAIGRFALPGQALTVQFVNTPQSGTYKYFLNTAIEGTTKYLSAPVDGNGKNLPDTGYRRPRLLQSPDLLLSTQSLTIVSPYGGTILLRFANTTDKTVTLRIKGAARHPFYDTTQGTPDAAAFFRDANTTKLGWIEIKTPGLEIHSVASMALNFLSPKAGDSAATVYPNPNSAYYSRQGGIDMAKYLDEAKRYVMEDAYQMAGFQSRDLFLNLSVQAFCNANSWDCTSSVHTPPVSKHFHSDFEAVCGLMCSSDPITSGEAFDPRGWGESHELGHNLQSLRIYGGITREVSNNIFPLHKKWRMFRELGRDAIAYSNQLGETQAVFDIINNASKLARDDQVAQVKAQLWTNAVTDYEQNRSRLYFYVQWVLIYYEALQSKAPTLTASQRWDQAWDVFALLYLHQRQVKNLNADNWDANKAKFGFAADEPFLATRFDTISNYHDYLLTALSFITGRNQSNLFNMWGIETSADARRRLSSKSYPDQPANFYAVVCSDDFRSYQSVDMTANQPAFPWVGAFDSATANLNACNLATTGLGAP
jgi:hypothetical protein